MQCTIKNMIIPFPWFNLSICELPDSRLCELVIQLFPCVNKECHFIFIFGWDPGAISGHGKSTFNDKCCGYAECLSRRSLWARLPPWC